MIWIGRYEAGLEEEKTRTSHTDITSNDKAVIKPNKIPYNYVTRDEAQELAKRMNYTTCTSSLLFGVQWDLVLKYIECKKAAEKINLTTDSTKIGNYYVSEFILNRGKFAQYNALSNWYDFNSEEKDSLVTGSKKKSQNSWLNGILLTSGATEATNLQNIYDLAGNVWEWTLEFRNENDVCVGRGGSYIGNGQGDTAQCGGGNAIDSSHDYLGFRIGLWK